MEKIDGVRDSRAGMEKVSYRNNKPGEFKKVTANCTTYVPIRLTRLIVISS
jgi:hypothetical protein